MPLEIVFALKREDVHFQNVLEKSLYNVSNARHVVFVVMVSRFSARPYTLSLGNGGVESGDVTPLDGLEGPACVWSRAR